MSTRSDGQRTGDKGEAFIAYLAEYAGGWIARPQLKDYGVDLELELDKPFVAGQLLKVQVRAHEKTDDEDAVVTAKVAKSELVYAQECRVPIILVVADTSAKNAYYCWMQRWLESDVGRAVLANDHASHHLKIPRTCELVAGLQGELREIALHRMPLQLWLGVRDVLRSAISLKDQRLVDALAELMAGSAAVGRLPIDDVLRELTDLGERIFGTDEGAKAQRVLFRLCTSLGAEFTADQIERMVIRDGGFSRTAIRALGVLYDHHFDAIRKLDLPNVFSTFEDPRVAYYCKLRHANPGKPGFELASPKTAFAIDGFTIDKDALEDLFRRWPNGGDAIFVDYCVPVDGVNSTSGS